MKNSKDTFKFCPIINSWEEKKKWEAFNDRTKEGLINEY